MTRESASAASPGCRGRRADQSVSEQQRPRRLVWWLHQFNSGVRPGRLLFSTRPTSSCHTSPVLPARADGSLLGRLPQFEQGTTNE
jgi:hypothetical protein